MGKVVSGKLYGNDFHLCLARDSNFFQAVSLAQQKASQHSVHLTLGSLRVFRHFLRLSFFLIGRRSAARPSASNAARWGADLRNSESFLCISMKVHEFAEYQ
jgi:hypothetical protein